MSLRINTNIAAQNAWRQLSTNNQNLQGSLARLSSGYRITRAADDAAGLAVSEKMKSQMRGISAALRNSQDAVSMIQTAESASGEIQNMVQRMRELAVQAGSDTYSDTDRAKLDQEFQALLSEVDRTTSTVNYNGRKLLNGASGDQAKITAGDEITGAKVNSALDTFTGTRSYTISVTQVAREQKLEEAANSKTAATAVVWNTTDSMDTLFGGTAFASGDKIVFTQSGKSMTIDLNATKTYTAAQFVDHVNSKAETAGMDMRVKYNTGLIIESNVDGTSGDVAVSETIADTDIVFGFSTAVGAGQASQDAAATITNNTTNVALVAGTDYTVSGNKITGVAGTDFQGMEITAAKVGGTDATLELSRNGLTFQVGANKGETIEASLANLSASNLGLSTENILTKSTADTALDALDAALTTLSGKRAEMGALQNRLESTISNLAVQDEQLTGANSRIVDVDMAKEMAVFTRNQILMQASTAMLGQANQLPQAVLQLIR